MTTTFRSYGFGKLSRIGSRNPANRISPISRDTRRIEVEVTQEGQNKAIDMSVLLPINRSECGSRRVAVLTLNGAQARELYNTLNEFYNDTSLDK